MFTQQNLEFVKTRFAETKIGTGSPAKNQGNIKSCSLKWYAIADVQTIDEIVSWQLFIDRNAVYIDEKTRVKQLNQLKYLNATMNKNRRTKGSETQFNKEKTLAE